ncbi:hypothetical protein AUM89_13975 [Cronobacter sakazakii]|nr:hypothetical protein [Cronobacter sakazakii]EGT4285924.1 hypothetical protein [Cronobacter sakazakii]EGT4294436.1 hypothetical protein [Cronobacter sakazakii]EGT4307522.1 hypothetical protein [Cronobacter sakazakii]EGT4311292.1 hypothetical protein [Cronobacter sakazakii]
MADECYGLEADAAVSISSLIVRAIYLMLNNHIVADNFRFSVATLLHVMLTIKRLSQSRLLRLSTA